MFDCSNLTDCIFFFLTGLCVLAQKLCLLKEADFNKWKDRDWEAGYCATCVCASDTGGQSFKASLWLWSSLLFSCTPLRSRPSMKGNSYRWLLDLISGSEWEILFLQEMQCYSKGTVQMKGKHKARKLTITSKQPWYWSIVSYIHL